MKLAKRLLTAVFALGLCACSNNNDDFKKPELPKYEDFQPDLETIARLREVLNDTTDVLLVGPEPAPIDQALSNYEAALNLYHGCLIVTASHECQKEKDALNNFMFEEPHM